jgi:hypothetical protein
MTTATVDSRDNAHFTMPDEPIYDISSLGDGLRLKGRKTVEMSTDFAENFLEQYIEFAGERPFYESHVVYLARHMEARTFNWDLVALITCLWEGREYRMNGRHTAWARMEANLPKGTRTPVQWLRYEAKTEQDMRQLFATIDRGKGRNPGNVVVSYLAGRDEFPGYSKSLLKSMAEGLALWKWEESHIRQLHTGDERSYLLLTDHHKTALNVGQFVRESDPKDFKHLKRMPVLAAMFATFDKAPAVARGFWATVRDGTGITDKGDSRHALRNYLMQTALAAKEHSSVDVRVVRQEEMYRACLMAWNAHRANKHLKTITAHKLDERPEVR